MIAVASMPSGFDLPLAGFRCWTIQRHHMDGPRLGSTSFDCWWDCPGVAVAGCMALPLEAVTRHSAPAPDCRCGLYAYSDLSLALAYARDHEELWRPGPKNERVVGAVLIWGDGRRRVLAGDLLDGAGPGLRYRAPYARVLALLDPGVARVSALTIGMALGLPVLPARGLELFAAEFGRLAHLRNGDG